MEHLWNVVERELRALDMHPTNLDQLPSVTELNPVSTNVHLNRQNI